MISFEAAFGRYGRDEANAGAQLLVVATNEGSYEFTPVSDQFIGMTRMRSAELGSGGGSLGGDRQVDLHHRWRDGRGGRLPGGEGHHRRAPALAEATRTLYTRWGEWVQGLAIVGLAVVLVYGVAEPGSSVRGQPRTSRLPTTR